MTIIFWGTIVTMIFAAIAFVAMPLRSSDRRLPLSWVFVLVLLPLTAAALYSYLGTPAAITASSSSAGQASRPTTESAEKAIPSVAKLVDGLRTKLEDDPNDADGWLLLAKSYRHLGQQQNALDAYEKARSLGQSDLDFETAMVAGSLAEEQMTVSHSTQISGRVSVSDVASEEIQATDTIFIFAKESLEQRMPIVALRKSAAELPITFSLTDEHIMVPGTSLADFAQLVVIARVSRSGKATDTLNGLAVSSGPISLDDGTFVDLEITAQASAAAGSDKNE